METQNEQQNRLDVGKKVTSVVDPSSIMVPPITLCCFGKWTGISR